MPYLSGALFAFTLLTIASFWGVATADDLLWARLAELTKEKMDSGQLQTSGRNFRIAEQL